jgi:hypothetical protein
MIDRYLPYQSSHTVVGYEYDSFVLGRRVWSLTPPSSMDTNAIRYLAAEKEKKG